MVKVRELPPDTDSSENIVDNALISVTNFVEHYQKLVFRSLGSFARKFPFVVPFYRNVERGIWTSLKGVWITGILFWIVGFPLLNLYERERSTNRR